MKTLAPALLTALALFALCGAASAATTVSLQINTGDSGASPAAIEIRDYEWAGFSRLPEPNRVSHRSGVLIVIFDGHDSALRRWQRTHTVIPSMELTVDDGAAGMKYTLEHCVVSSWSSFGNAQHATIVYQTVRVAKTGAGD